MRRSPLRLALLLLLLLLPGALGAVRSDPGLRLVLDREQFRVLAFDLRDGGRGPTFAVALGAPGRATPAGRYPLRRVVHNPAWTPGPEARARGARSLPPSLEGPMGAAKIPFDAHGHALHGGADPRLLGKRISLGCVRATDADLLALIRWLASRGALSEPEPRPNGEALRGFLRRTLLVIR